MCKNYHFFLKLFSTESVKFSPKTLNSVTDSAHALIDSIKLDIENLFKCEHEEKSYEFYKTIKRSSVNSPECKHDENWMGNPLSKVSHDWGISNEILSLHTWIFSSFTLELTCFEKLSNKSIESRQSANGRKVHQLSLHLESICKRAFYDINRDFSLFSSLTALRIY